MELNNSIIIMTFVYCNSSCEGNTLRKTIIVFKVKLHAFMCQLGIYLTFTDLLVHDDM